MHPYEEKSLGRLLTDFRNRTRRTGSEIAPLLKGYWSPSRISSLENDNTGRPEVDMLESFRDVYRLTPLEYSFLLAAADYAPSEDEIRAMYVTAFSELAAFEFPAYVVNYRYQLLFWNDAFAAIYGSAQLPSVIATTPLSARTLGTLSSGSSLFELLFGPNSPFRSQLDHAEWERVTHYFLVRFWRTTLRLIRPGWWSEGYHRASEPHWLRETLHKLNDLPGTGGAEFRRRSQQVREQLLEDWRNPTVQLVAGPYVDCVPVRQARARFLLTPTLLLDARFIAFYHHPTTSASLDAFRGIPPWMRNAL